MSITRINPVYTLPDSGWLTLPLASGWVAYSSAQTPRYRKVGGVVQVVGAVKPTANTTVGSDFVTVGTLPAGYRATNRILALNPASGNNRVSVSAETSGEVTVGRYGTGSGFVTVTPSNWVPITIMFLA